MKDEAAYTDRMPSHQQSSGPAGPSHFCIPPNFFISRPIVSLPGAIENSRVNASIDGKCPLQLVCLSTESDQIGLAIDVYKC